MSDNFTQYQPVMLGSLIFFGFETPSRINYGTGQAITTHRFPRGGRVFDPTGGDPAPISWTGILLGLGRYEKQSAAEVMRQAGKIVRLRWGKWNLPVIIQAIHYKEGFQRIDYTITVLMMTVVVTQEDAQNNTGEADKGTGEQPSEPTAASGSGRQVISNARAAAPTWLPVPPILPGAPSLPPSAYTPGAVPRGAG